jgi:hypothetical protein
MIRAMIRPLGRGWRAKFAKGRHTTQLLHGGAKYMGVGGESFWKHHGEALCQEGNRALRSS